MQVALRRILLCLTCWLLLSRALLIKTITCEASIPRTTMSATERYPEILTDIALPRHQLLEIHRSKISLDHAKNGYGYPTIKLPYTFSKLAVLLTRIYLTVHERALGFLVVMLLNEKTSKCSESFAFTRRQYSY